MLQPDAHGDRERVHQGPEGRALLVHVHEDLTQRAVVILAGPQEHLVAADDGLLGETAAPIRQAAAPDESLSFLLVGTAVLLPMILGYTIYSYRVFRGKVRPGEGYH